MLSATTDVVRAGCTFARQCLPARWSLPGSRDFGGLHPRLHKHFLNTHNKHLGFCAFVGHKKDMTYQEMMKSFKGSTSRCAVKRMN